VSLDVEIPLRGTAFYFTAPHGDVEMDARAVSETSLARASRSFWGLIGLGLLVFALRYTRRKEKLAKQALDARRKQYDGGLERNPTA
jgi:hypothetical protein